MLLPSTISGATVFGSTCRIAIATSLMPPLIPGHLTEDLYPRADNGADIAKAKEHLELAGYVDGKKDGTQLSINIVYPAGYPEWKQGSEMLQAALAELGVDLKAIHSAFK